jgi:predicted transcriptional regulator of viral defense system
LYLVLPLEAGQGSAISVEDPWSLAVELFAPCYIAGWTAAEHWGLTEQIFRSTFVATAATVRSTTQTVLGAEFRLARVHPRRIATAKPTWRGALRIPVSDREATLADALAVPAWVGGVRHLADMLAVYRASANWAPSRLIQCLEAVGSGAAFKRLGLLGEVLFPDSMSLIAACEAHRTSGNVKLDPAVKGRGKLSKRWGLWVNVTVRGSGGGG